ncbi:MAG: response regulator transcription factor [Acidobacteriota bacterium]
MTRVMVVDDDPLLRRALACALARCGYDVSIAHDGERALRIAQITAPSVAIVDLHMPGGGLALVRELKRLGGDAIHVAVLSGEDADVIAEACGEAGADEVLSKPITPAELRRRVAAAIASLAAEPASAA